MRLPDANLPVQYPCSRVLSRQNKWNHLMVELFQHQYCCQTIKTISFISNIKPICSKNSNAYITIISISTAITSISWERIISNQAWTERQFNCICIPIVQVFTSLQLNNKYARDTFKHCNTWTRRQHSVFIRAIVSIGQERAILTLAIWRVLKM